MASGDYGGPYPPVYWHTCLRDDGGTPNRRCEACEYERLAAEGRRETTEKIAAYLNRTRGAERRYWEPEIRALARERRRLKTAPKQYKTGPRPSGRARLQARVLKLSIDLNRLIANPKTSPEDRAWAEHVAAHLRQAICDPVRPLAERPITFTDDE